MTESTTERFLVTGALGCIGAWTVRDLAREGVPVVAFDVAAAPRRVRNLCTDEEFERITFVTGDITELASIEAALDEHGVTNVIHLAALQVPFCRADPVLGARVNVLGTVNVLEAVRRRSDRIRQLAYTGSVGMFDAADADPATGRLEAGAPAHPVNHYGVYKQANEGNARVYWLDNGVSSIGLRPMTVYGPGRDQGLTSTPSRAILAALLGQPITIGFSGRTLFQYADDVARTLILASRSTMRGANTFNLGGELVDLHDFVRYVEEQVPGSEGLITVEGAPLPFPEDISAEGLAAVGPAPVTPIRDGIAQTVAFFRRLMEADRLVPAEHGL